VIYNLQSTVYNLGGNAMENILELDLLKFSEFVADIVEETLEDNLRSQNNTQSNVFENRQKFIETVKAYIEARYISTNVLLPFFLEYQYQVEPNQTIHLEDMKEPIQYTTPFGIFREIEQRIEELIYTMYQQDRNTVHLFTEDAIDTLEVDIPIFNIVS